MVVPLGKPIDTKVQNPHGYTLNYNEFIVYDVKQIKMKYLVKVKFNFKWSVTKTVLGFKTKELPTYIDIYYLLPVSEISS